MKKDHYSAWVIIVVAIITSIVIPFFLYFSVFRGTLSTDSNQWTNFAIFWSAFVAIANTLALTYLTYYFQKRELDRNVILERPIISIALSGESYKLSNVGKGAALNIYAYSSSGDDYKMNKFTQKRICYSLNINADFQRDWLNGELIIVEFMDIFNQKYFSMMKQDVLHIFDHSYRPLVGSNVMLLSETIQKFNEYMK